MAFPGTFKNKPLSRMSERLSYLLDQLGKRDCIIIVSAELPPFACLLFQLNPHLSSVIPVSELNCPHIDKNARLVEPGWFLFLAVYLILATSNKQYRKCSDWGGRGQDRQSSQLWWKCVFGGWGWCLAPPTEQCISSMALQKKRRQPNHKAARKKSKA